MVVGLPADDGSATVALSTTRRSGCGATTSPPRYSRPPRCRPASTVCSAAPLTAPCRRRCGWSLAARRRMCRRGSRSPRRERATRCTPSSSRSPTHASRSRARSVLDRSVVLCETNGSAHVTGSIDGEDVDFVGSRGIRVALWLSMSRRCCGALSGISKTRCPTATACLLNVLGPMVVAGRCRRRAVLAARWLPAGGVGRHGRSGAHPDHQLAGRHPEPARRRSRSRRSRAGGHGGVQGALDDILRAHDTLLAYVHAAVRAPSHPELLSALRAGPR